jgi:hypothetical protein
VPGEEDTAATTASATGDSGSGLLASPAGAAPVRRTDLGPRAYFEPIRVWIGGTPPTAVAADEDGAAKAARRAVKAAARVTPKSLARTKAPGPPASATAYTAASTPAVMDEGKRTKPVSPAAALAPVPPRPKAAASPAPKPAAKAAAVVTPAAKPAAKAAAPAPKSAAAAKPAQAKVATKPHPKAKAAVKPKADE